MKEGKSGPRGAGSRPPKSGLGFLFRVWWRGLALYFVPPFSHTERFTSQKMSSQDDSQVKSVYMVTFSKHFGIQKKAYATFEEAWSATAKAVAEGNGVVYHPDAATCFSTDGGIQPSFTQNWKVGQLPGDALVGPAMVFKMEL